MNSLIALILAVLCVLLASVGVPVASAALSMPLGCGALASDFRVTTFASGLNFPHGLALLPDGSLLVATSKPDPSGGFFTSGAELYRFVDVDRNGVADGPGTLMYSDTTGALTSLRVAGSLVFITSVENGLDQISVLRMSAGPAAPYSLIGDLSFTFPAGWEHKSYALAVRPAPGAPAGTWQLFFNVGAAGNNSESSATVGLGGLIEGTLQGSSIYRVTVTETPTGVTVSDLTRIARGLRNAAGMDFHPVTGDFYFQDNGIDGLVDRSEPLSADELNRIAAASLGVTVPNFGFPGDYIQYRTGTRVGSGGVQPLIAFQPIPAPNGSESEGAVGIAFAPAGFPAGLNNGVFVGFHGKGSLAGVANEENPVVFVNLANGTYCHFVSNAEPSVGHLNSVVSSDRDLFVADMASNGPLGATAAGMGVIYQVHAVGTEVRITATDAVATEAGPTTGTFTVTRSGSTTSALTVPYTVSGTATPGSDYAALTGQVVIPAGATTATITVTPVNDVLMEGPETVIVTLAPSAAYTVGSPSSATVTIASDETVRIVATDATATEAGRTTGTFTVTRTGSAAAALTVSYNVGGTARAGNDYVPLSRSVVIPAGATTATITLTPIDDTDMEGLQNVVVTLAPNAQYTVGSPSSATVTIVSDETVRIVATDATATEAGPTTGTFTVTRTGSTATALTVSYNVAGTATPGNDYVALSRTVVIPAGATTATITVRPVNDTLMERPETVVVTLAPSAGYTVGSPSTATVTIASDETVRITATDPTATEAGPTTGTFTVTRTGSTTTALTVNYTVGGTATPGIDYVALSRTVVIPAGAISATITVRPVNDALVEGPQTVVVTLASSGSYTVGSPGSATVTIADND